MKREENVDLGHGQCWIPNSMKSVLVDVEKMLQ